MFKYLLISLLFSGFISCVPAKMEGLLVHSLMQLHNFSEATQADTVYVLRKGRPIFYHQTSPQDPCFDTQEMAHSFIALAVVLLIDEGKLPPLDLPLKYYFAEDSKYYTCDLTLRDLLSTPFSLAKTDRAAPLLEVIQQTSGETPENYLLKRLFVPLGIEHFSWSKSDQEWTPRLSISAGDLGRVGLMILEQGLYFGTRIISKESLDLLFQPTTENPFVGLQWRLQLWNTEISWDPKLLQAYRAAHLDEEIICKLEALQGRVISVAGSFYKGCYLSMNPAELCATFGTIEKASKFISSVECAGLPIGQCSPGGVQSISSVGSGGQQLAIIPSKNIVGVRQKHKIWAYESDTDNVSFIGVLKEIPDYCFYPPPEELAQVVFPSSDTCNLKWPNPKMWAANNYR